MLIYPIKKKVSIWGFTLIELLVVIAIIGVLATVVLASLNSARRKSRDARRVSDIRQLKLALEFYFDGAGAGNYPPGNSNACDGTQANVYGLNGLVTNGYITSIPHDPNAPTPATSCYRYLSATVGSATTFYHLGAVLEDPANTTLNSDRDCDDVIVSPTAGFCLAGGPFIASGMVVQGINSVNCIAPAGVAGTDRCYDVIP